MTKVPSAVTTAQLPAVVKQLDVELAKRVNEVVATYCRETDVQLAELEARIVVLETGGSAA